MRAVIIATGHAAAQAQFSLRHSPPLLPLLDRPFLQHVIEHIAGMGILSCDIILSNDPEKYEALLGNGKRWGCSFTLRLARDAARPYHMLQPALAGQPGSRLLLAHADMLPQIDAGMLDAAGPALICAPSQDPSQNGQISWTGWAIVDAQDIATAPADADAAALEQHLRGRGALSVPVPRVLGVRSYGDMIAAQRMVLAGEFEGLMFGGQKAADGIWLSRNVSLHPTARLNPPVYIGPNCRIGAGVSLGPNAVIGSDCILDSHCLIADSAVLPGSYVGEMLELQDCIVDRNLLVNTRIGGAVSVSDDFILGCVSCSSFGGGLARVLSRVLGALLLAALLPLLLATMLVLKIFRKGPVCFRREAVMLPTPDDPLQWKTFRLLSFSDDGASAGSFPWLRHFLLHFLPGLVHVALGHLRIVGVAPRSAAQIQQLFLDWQALFCSSKIGMITEALVVYGQAPMQDELYSAEAFYAVSAGPWHDVKLCFAYVARLFRRS